MKIQSKHNVRYPVAQGCVLDLRFMEGSGSKVKDFSGKGNHGTAYNMTWSRGTKGLCGSFNGTNSYVNCDNKASLNITNAITIESWEFLNSGAGLGYIVSKNLLSSADMQYSLYYDSGNFRVVAYFNGVSAGTSANNSVLTGKWNHTVMTWDKEYLRFYVNGVISGTPASYTTALTPTNYSVNVGRRNPNNVYFNGTLDEVRVYNRRRTANQAVRRNEQFWYDYCKCN